MKRVLMVALVLLLAWDASAEPLSFGPFGEILVRGRTSDPAMVIVLLSDSSGWGAVEEDMAGIAGEAGALVLGVDCRRYFAHVEAKGYQPNVSHEISTMSKYIQKTLGLPRLMQSFLLGYGDGAGVAYASLVQAPARVFSGALSLGFRPEIPLTQPFGWGRGLVWTKTAAGVRYAPFTKVPLPWTVIQAEEDPLFSAVELRDYVRDLPGVRVEVLAEASGYGRGWQDLLRGTLDRAGGAASVRVLQERADIGDLPVIEVRPQEPATGTMAVFVTGDGGWAGIDKDIAAILGRHGIGVVGLDSLRYFWTRRTPEQAGADLARLIRHYMQAWDAQDVVCIGFSLGADAIPSMVTNLPAELKESVRQVSLLAPSRHVELEFHITDWIHDDEASQDIALLPEVRKLGDLPLLCLYGSEEKVSLCMDLDPGLATVHRLPGSHHFNGDYAKVAELILEHLRATQR